jgi:hypothetical protein
MVRQMDHDQDGRITREESGAAPWFNRIDQNEDNVIDAAELDRVRRAMKRPGNGGGPAPAAMPSVTPEDLAKVTSGPEILPMRRSPCWTGGRSAWAISRPGREPSSP